MQEDDMQITFETVAKGLDRAETPIGPMFVTHVPGHGPQGYIKLHGRRPHVWVEAGKFGRSRKKVQDAMLSALVTHMGLDGNTSLVLG
jgi:hypothetical protein